MWIPLRDGKAFDMLVLGLTGSRCHLITETLIDYCIVYSISSGSVFVYPFQIVPNETLKVIAKRLISKVQIPLRLYPLIALIIAIIYFITSLLLVVWLIRKERAKKILKKFHMSTGDVTLSDSSVSDSSESRTLSWYDNLLSTDRGPESHAQREEQEDTTDSTKMGYVFFYHHLFMR